MYCFYKYVILHLLIISASCNQTETTINCPKKCLCKRSVQKDGASFIKMRCGGEAFAGADKILYLDEIELLNMASEIVQLNLSDNLLKTFSTQVELIALQKLNLSGNEITDLKANQFSETPNLRRLDLSMNKIKYIDISAFSGLKQLERLKLNQNQISSILLGTFDSLISLNQLDIAGNPLVCDCGLLWLLEWKKSMKLLSNPKCASPQAFKNFSFRKLRIGADINCKSKANNGQPMIELRPNENQVVFEGDSLKLQCRAPSFTDNFDDPNSGKLVWVSDASADVSVENQHFPSNGLIDSTLVIHKLRRNHTGRYNCIFVSLQGNFTRNLSVVVISPDTKYCQMTVTTNNKGSYNWPRTVVNNTVVLPCESLNLNYDTSRQSASYFCQPNGDWSNLNTANCSFISDTTKILEQFSKVNSSLLESARHFRNFTSNLRIFDKDIMDLVFTVDTVDNYLKFPEYLQQIGGILLDVVNNLMQLPRVYLWEANYNYRSCGKLLNATEKLATLGSSSTLQKSNIALVTFPLKKDTFNGLKCTWYVNLANRHDSIFSCVMNNEVETTSLPGKTIEASITIPKSLFKQLDDEQELPNRQYNIMVAVHATGKLFPINLERKGKEDVTSSVIGVKIDELLVENLTEPVFVMLRTPPTLAYDVMPFVPVFWSESLHNWDNNSCEFHHTLTDHTVFSCSNFGYYGLMQDVRFLQNSPQASKFKLSHPAIYVGSFILFTTFLVVILTYLLCYNAIQMPKKAKHSLVNMWIAINLLCFFYVFGIYQTEDVKVCQVVGMILHYFTLCSILWMCVGVNCMYKRLNKNEISLQDDDLPSDQPVQKPILGLYLVGWGISLIICGLSAAINMKEYSSPNHCFLRSGPALSALYIPIAILSAFLSVFFLLIRCAINMDANGHLSEGTQATEHVDLDMLDSNFPNIVPDTISISSKTASSEVEDPEHGPSAQLKAYIIFLLLYVSTWLSCAFATVPPFHFADLEEDLFSILFAILATTLSAFTIFFYCVARNDVRTQWMIFTRYLKRKRTCFRSRNVSDTIPQIQIQPLPLPPTASIVESIPITSRSSSRTSNTKSNTSNILKGAVDLNGSYTDPISGAKINNVNLVVLHRAQYRSTIPNIIENPTNAAEVFYNPHQSTVARKFFKRQKRNMMKRNNLRPATIRDHSDSASMFSEPNENSKKVENMFGTNSKVNNTNIHVEYTKKMHQKNPNLFSDSAEDDDTVPVEDIVKNAERLRRKELSKYNKTRKKPNHDQFQMPESNMRSVSQQCTLDYSSENISDSILALDKDKTQEFELDCDMRHENSLLTQNTEDKNDSCCTQMLYNQNKLNYEPSELTNSSSLLDHNEEARIYVNPTHDLLKNGASSRASSVSVSDLDELYQQIRRGPAIRPKPYLNSDLGNCCLSDSEITSYISDLRQHCLDDNDDIETTV